MYYSNNDWYVCASCTKALRFQSTSAANKLQAWIRLNVLPFSLHLVTPLKKQCLINLENTQRIIRFSCNEQNFKRHLCSKTHEKFRLVVNLFIIITVFRDQKSNVLRCTPAATMYRDSFVFDYRYNFLFTFGAASHNNNNNNNNNNNDNNNDNDNKRYWLCLTWLWHLKNL